jgi:type IV secretory pathway VirB4 component
VSIAVFDLDGIGIVRTRRICLKDRRCTSGCRISELLADVESNGALIGEFALTLIVDDTDPQQLAKATAEAFKAFAAKDAVLCEEKQNVLLPWLAPIPGGHRNQFRSPYVTNRNYPISRCCSRKQMYRSGSYGQQDSVFCSAA